MAMSLHSSVKRVAWAIEPQVHLSVMHEPKFSSLLDEQCFLLFALFVLCHFVLILPKSC